MNRSVVQRLIPIFFIIVVIGLVVAGLMAVMRIVFDGGAPEATEDTMNNNSLLEMANDRKVRMSVRGPIVADELFRKYEVTITPDSRDLIRYQGYLEDPIGDKSYPNNVKAYSEFVHALVKANFAAGEPFTGEADDTTGLCATGQLHEYEIINGDTVVERLWTTTCEGLPGSLQADDALLRQLFLAQIPEADEVIGKD